MVKNIKVVEGKLEYDSMIFGECDYCGPDLCIDSDQIESLFSDYRGKTIRVTIEEIEPKSE